MDDLAQRLALRPPDPGAHASPMNERSPDLRLITPLGARLVLGGTRSSAPHSPPTPQPLLRSRAVPPARQSSVRLSIQESRSPCPSPAEEGDPAWPAPEWQTLASRGRRPSRRGVPSAGPRHRAMRSTLPGGAIPPSQSQKGPHRWLTSAQESGSRSAPEGTPGTRGRLRVLRWTLGTGQSPPSRWAGLLSVATAGILVLVPKGPRGPRVQARSPRHSGPLGTGHLATVLFRALPRRYWARLQGGPETGPPLIGRSPVTQSSLQPGQF